MLCVYHSTYHSKSYLTNLREIQRSLSLDPKKDLMISNTPLKTSRLNSFSSPQVVDKVTLGLEVLNVSTVGQDLVVGLEGLVVGSVERSETPLLGDDDSLLTRD
jgi:hypothetical protein